jgi:hypothetical protein
LLNPCCVIGLYSSSLRIGANALHPECKRRGRLPLLFLQSREARSEPHWVVSSCAVSDLASAGLTGSVCHRCERDIAPKMPTASTGRPRCPISRNPDGVE